MKVFTEKEKNEKYEVGWDNEILGKGSRIVTLEELSRWNLVAYLLAKTISESESGDDIILKNGMWTVRRYKEEKHVGI